MNFFIEIEDLKVDTIIGVFDEERLKPQTILISIKCQLDHYLPVSGLGNLRACCLPWMW